MNDWIKKGIVSCLCVVLIAGMAGCSTGKDNSKPDPNGGKIPEMNTTDDITLSIWWMETEQHAPVLKAAIEEFKKVYPNITIKPEWQTSFDNNIKLKTAMIGETAPDIVKIDHVYTASFGYNEQIFDLNKYGAGDIKDQFIESTWNANVYDQAVYGLPFDANTVAFFYNKDLFQKAGVSVPKTYTEIISAGKAIQALKLPNTYAYTVPVTTSDSGWLTFEWLSWLWRNGGEVLNADMTEAAFAGKEGVQALTQMVDLIRKEGVVPENQYLEADFYTGTVGMLDMGCWSLQKVLNSEYGSFGVAELPVLKDGVTNHSGLGLYSMAVTSQSKHPREAYEFIKFLTTTAKYQVDYAKTNAFMPSLKAAYTDDYFSTEEWQVFRSTLEKSKSRPCSPSWPDISENLNNALQQVLTEGRDPAEALAEAAENVNQAIIELSE